MRGGSVGWGRRENGVVYLEGRGGGDYRSRVPLRALERSLGCITEVVPGRERSGRVLNARLTLGPVVGSHGFHT